MVVWLGIVVKLLFVGLWLNVFKLEFMLECGDFFVLYNIDGYE